MNIKSLTFFVLLSLSMQSFARRPIDQYSLQGKMAALQVLKNPSLKAKLFSQFIEEQSVDVVSADQKGLWQQFTDWLGSWF